MFKFVKPNVGMAVVLLMMMIYGVASDCPGNSGVCDCCNCCGGATILGGCAGACFGGCPGASGCSELCGGLSVGQIVKLVGLSAASLTAVASTAVTAGASAPLTAAIVAGTVTATAVTGTGIALTDAEGNTITVDLCQTKRKLKSLDDNTSSSNNNNHVRLSKFICSYGDGTTVSGNNMCVLHNDTVHGMTRTYNGVSEVSVLQPCNPHFDNGITHVNVTNLKQHVPLVCPPNMNGVGVTSEKLRSLELWTPGTKWINPFGNEHDVKYEFY